MPPLQLRLGRGRIAATGLALLAFAGAGQALAQDDGEDLTPPPRTFQLPGITVRIAPTQISQSARERVTFTAEVTRRRLARGSLDLTLPRPWLDVAETDDRPVAIVPRRGTGTRSRVKVRRDDRVVRITFVNARRGDRGTFTVTDRALAPGTYRPRFALRLGGRYAAATATGAVVVLAAPVVVPVAP